MTYTAELRYIGGQHHLASCTKPQHHIAQSADERETGCPCRSSPTRSIGGRSGTDPQMLGEGCDSMLGMGRSLAR